MKSIVFLLLATLFWGLNFYLGKIMMEYVSPNASAFWRYFFGVITLLAFSITSFPSRRDIVDNLTGILLVGFLGIFGFNYFFFKGLELTSPMNGVLIMSLNPAITVLLTAIFQRHRIDIQQVAGIILALCGVVFLLTEGQLLEVLRMKVSKGDGYFLMANLVFAFHNLWIRKYATRLGNLSFTTLTNLVCVLGFGLLFFTETQPNLAELPATFWWSAIGMGVPGTALAYFFWNYGMNTIGPARGAIFGNATPLFVAFFGLLFGSQLYSYHAWSTLLILGGLLLMQVPIGKKRGLSNAP